jgi:TonB family protein
MDAISLALEDLAMRSRAVLTLLLTLAVPRLPAQVYTFLPNGTQVPIGGARQCEKHKSEGVELALGEVDVVAGLDTAYSADMVQAISSRFRPEESDRKRRARLRVVLRRDGSVSSITVLKASGDAAFDQVAKSAVSDAGLERAFAPLPSSYGGDSLPVTVAFGEHIRGNDAFIEQWQLCPAWPLRDNPRPAYPNELRQHDINGEVLALFVVDSTGHADPRTFRVLRSSSPAFSAAVEEILPALRFAPAEVKGRKVAQRTQQLFKFDFERYKEP